MGKVSHCLKVEFKELKRWKKTLLVRRRITPFGGYITPKFYQQGGHGEESCRPQVGESSFLVEGGEGRA